MTHTILWRRLDLPGHEAAILERRAQRGWELRGTAVFAYEGRPCRLDYVVVCDADWRTDSARVRGTIDAREVELQATVDAQRRWRLNGIECAAVSGCADIDLGFSPATNLLPIRRLAMAVGREADVHAAWLSFPELAFERLEQTYRRESETTYRYEADGGRFVRTLEVDPRSGFLLDYPGLWRLEAASDLASD
jgi:hypothetical protein